jgi:hypothetical protein
LRRHRDTTYAGRSGAGARHRVSQQRFGLAIVTIVDQLAHLSAVLMFWSVLWAGLVTATVSLWAALYRPSVSESPAE